MIYQKEVPYLLTILFVVLGYTIKTFSDRLYDYSFVEYQYITTKTDDLGNYFAYRITNATPDKVYDSLKFSIIISEHDSLQFNSGKIVPSPPLFIQRDLNISRKNEREMGNRYANFMLRFLIPGASYTIKIYYEGIMSHSPELLFRMSEMADAKLDFSDPVIVLKKANWLTWLGKNQFTVLMILVVIWISTILIYLNYANKNQSNIDNIDAVNG
jgi:hypothetical protein